jgi:hypothetical protein
MVTGLLDWVVVGIMAVNAGPFVWGLTYGVGGRVRGIGGRLVYIPTKDSDVYLATIASWKAQMAAA